MTASIEQLLCSQNNILEEILAELRRGNSIERTGSVSSVQIEDFPTKDRPVRVTSKQYAGSPLPVDEALEDHARLHREAERRAADGWAEAIDVAQHMRVNGCEMQVDGPGAWHWKHSETCLSRLEP